MCGLKKHVNTKVESVVKFLKFIFSKPVMFRKNLSSFEELLNHELQVQKKKLKKFVNSITFIVSKIAFLD